jgi:hypothetical protein
MKTCVTQVLLGLAYIMSLLEFVHAFIKFAQMRDAFVCDLVVAIKVPQSDIYKMYCDQTSKFTIDKFGLLNHCWSWNMKTSRCSGYLT